MKHLFVLVICLCSFGVSSQTIPDKGDFISIHTAGFDSSVQYIFKNRMVYFDHNPFTNATGNTYQQDEKMVKELFALIEKHELDKLYRLDEKKITLGAEVYNYRIIEYRKGENISRVCWDSMADDEISRKLNEIEGKMNSFW